MEEGWAVISTFAATVNHDVRGQDSHAAFMLRCFRLGPRARPAASTYEVVGLTVTVTVKGKGKLLATLEVLTSLGPTKCTSLRPPGSLTLGAVVCQDVRLIGTINPLADMACRGGIGGNRHPNLALVLDGGEL
jgi:hypothetical protein